MRGLFDADVFCESESGEVEGLLQVGCEACVAGFGPAGPEGRRDAEGARVAEFEGRVGVGVGGDVLLGDLGSGV